MSDRTTRSAPRPPRPPGTTPTSRGPHRAPTPRPARGRVSAPPPPKIRLPRFGLSPSQLIATGLAAATAAVAGSFLGVSGTVIGTALASVLTAVGNAVYGQSLRRTGERVRHAVPLLPSGAAAAPPERPLPGPGTATDHRPPELPRPVPRPQPGRRVVGWKAVALAAVGVFVAVTAVITGVELVAGRPLADVLRGDRGSGTTLFGNSGPTRVVPGPTVTVTPSVVTETPTMTQTAPAATRTVTPPPSTVTGSGSTGASTGSTPSEQPSSRASTGSTSSSSPAASTGRSAGRG